MTAKCLIITTGPYTMMKGYWIPSELVTDEVATALKNQYSAGILSTSFPGIVEGYDDEMLETYYIELPTVLKPLWKQFHIVDTPISTNQEDIPFFKGIWKNVLYMEFDLNFI